MANYTLGIDVGSNSIGWALVEEGGEGVIAAGVRVFPEGVARNQQGGELSKNEQRRIARGMRRQTARRSRRKRQLRAALVTAGLLPTDPDQQRALETLDPYVLRRRALDEPLTPYEIGRVLIHLNQRRGFRSNRKTDRARKKENSEMLADISSLAAEIDAAGHRTLGEHLATLQQANRLTRIRGKHTRRDMLEGEFQAIWEKQREYQPALLTDELRTALHKIIFFQRPMYWPKSVVGTCELEPKLKRCPRADRAAQRFRLLQEVNNLRIIPQKSEPRPLSADERKRLTRYLERAKERTFDQIRKHLGLLEGDGFNLEIGDRKKLLGMPTDAILASKKLFGTEWYDRSDDERNAIVRTLLKGDDDESIIRKMATAEWGLSADTVDSLLDADLGEGYARFSREAIEKLLPYLEAGLPLMKSGEGISCALEAAGYLRPDQRVVHQRDFLPAPPEVANPIVRQALFEFRKVVNAILREYGLPSAIHIELARDVKGTAEMRKRLSRDMRDREHLRSEAADRIREHGIKVNRDAIDRYLLWREQGQTCIYSGRPISITQLFGGDVDIDHILPYPRSLDNSLMNRVVAFRSENSSKGDRTPFEWLAETEPEKYAAVLQRASQLPYEVRNRKRVKFVQQTVELSDFISRQLVDTAYIARTVADYVRCLGIDPVCSKGQLTADLRYRWGLNEVLRDDGLNLKNREDHRHHAIDAIVIALTDRSRLQQLARTRRRNAEPETLPEPWPGFRGEVDFMVNQIHVSHRPVRRISGALHEETIYGPTQKRESPEESLRPRANGWVENPDQFVQRKGLEDLTPSAVQEIRDPEVKRLVLERLEQYRIDLTTAKRIPKEVWTEPLYMTRKSGRTSSRPNRIQKVRLIKKDRTIQPIRGGAAFVKLGRIHHVVLFETTDSKGRLRWDKVSVSMLEASQRAREGKPLVCRVHSKDANARFVMSLGPGETILVEIDGQPHLLTYRKSKSTENRVYFADHRDARKSDAIKLWELPPSKLLSASARKVTVDPLGRLRWATD